jgi:lysophospholipase L1-like esterase
MTTISTSDPRIQYIGRIGLNDPAGAQFFYAGSYTTLSFQGTAVTLVISDEGYWNENANTVGLIVDGGELSVHPLVKGVAHQRIQAASGLDDGDHTLTLVKLVGPGNGRGCITLHGIELEPGRDLLPPPPLPKHKIEAYGDSVTEGEGAACPEGTHDCGPDGFNGWLSYANVLARHLDCQIHNVGIGGLSVLNGTGWYESGNTGLEATYDKLNPTGDAKTPWDFTRYTPDLVLMALGVNDQSKGGFDDLPRWQTTYKRIVHDIHNRYGSGALPFVFAVAPLNTLEAYRNVAQIAEELKAEGLNTFFYHYSFEVNGHPNMAEAGRMGVELAEFITAQRLLE